MLFRRGQRTNVAAFSGAAAAQSIAFVAAADGGHVTTASSFTWSYTCGSGSSRLLIVGLNGDISTDKITGVTYAGAAMTLVNKQLVPSSRWQYLFYLLAPASGANNVVISASGNCDFILAGGADYTGVKQSSQPDASTTNSGASVTGSLTTSVTTVADNDWAVLLDGGFNSGNGPPVASTGATRRTFEGSFGTWGLFDSGGVVHPASSYSMTTTRGSSTAGMGHLVAAFSHA